MQNIIWKKGIVIGIVLLFFGASVIPLVKAEGPVYNTNTGKSFNTIQEAIDDTDTTDGDTIQVNSGTYQESIHSYTKQLIIQGIDTGAGLPVLDANGESWGGRFHQTVSFSNFFVKNAIDYGLYLTGDSNTVYNVYFMDNLGDGLYIASISDNSVAYCWFENNGVGLYCWGIVSSDISYDTFTANQNGMYLDNAFSNTIAHHSIFDNYGEYGIKCQNSNTNLFFANMIYNNNGYGLMFSGSNNNTLYNNYFNQNTFNAQDDGYNIWNIDETPGTNMIGGPNLGGNYWSDYAGSDSNGDGFGDAPYTTGILYSADNLPLIPSVRYVSPTTGGIAWFWTYPGVFSFLAGIEEWSLSAEAQNNKPAGLDLPFGLFNFTITGLTYAEMVTVTITLPNNVPIGSEWWKVNPNDNSWYSLPIGSDDGDNIITLDLTDGGLGDHDGMIDEKIVDPGGIGILTTDYVYVDDNAPSEWYDATHVLTIQEGVDIASDGNTIFVYGGTYTENVVVYKPVSLIGENKDTTFIEGNNDSDGIVVNANDVSISGFTLQNNRDGVVIGGCSNCRIFDNIIFGNLQDGIQVYQSSYCFVSGNHIESNAWTGIYVRESSCNLSGNTILSNSHGIDISMSSDCMVWGNSLTATGTGVFLEEDSQYNQIIGNTASSNDYGIFSTFSSNNTIAGNEVSGNTNNGINLDQTTGTLVEGNTVFSNNDGIYLFSSANNTIIGNNIYENILHGIYMEGSLGCDISGNTLDSNGNSGVMLSWCPNSTIEGNNITANMDGIFIDACTDDVITGNMVSSNTGYGIYFTGFNNNLIYNNYFDMNTNYAYDPGVNRWNTTQTPGINIIGGVYLGGNYWGDYTGSDTNGDGLGDTDLPYNSNGGIQNGGDWLPLTTPSVSLPTQVYIDDDYTSSTPGWGYDHFPTIQEGIDGVAIGGIINVSTGYYPENVLVNKAVQLYGEDRENTIVDGGDITNTFMVTVSHIVINGFKIINGNTVYPNAGIFLDHVEGSIINHNNISGNNGHGIFDMWGTGNQIFDNILIDNTLTAIRIDGTEAHASVHNNSISYNHDTGIFIYSADTVLIENNTIAGNALYGISPQGFSTNITIRYNTISGNTKYGVWVASCPNGCDIHHNTMSDNQQPGLYLYFSNVTHVSHNTFLNDGMYVRSSYGNIVDLNTVNGKPLVYLDGVSTQTVDPAAGQVVLVDCDNITVQNCILTHADVGLELWDSSDCLIIENQFANNSHYGVVTGNSSDNTIIHNNFVDNILKHVYIPLYGANSINTWDDGYPSGGNYWDTYAGVDTNHGPAQDIPGSDGIGDTSYVINVDNQDHYPLMTQQGWELNYPPYAPMTPSPSNESTDAPLNILLGWMSDGDPNFFDLVTFDVYFGTSSTPARVSNNQSSSSYFVSNLDYDTMYYWRIVAWDNHGAFTYGPLWSFTTSGTGWDVTILSNNPGGQNDYVVFGEAPGAHDGPPADSYDILKPPAPQTPYIRTWLNDNLPTPFNSLMKDYRSFPDSSKVWNLTIHWMPSSGASPTTITVSWNTAEFSGCEYSSVTLCTEGGIPLQNMLVNNAYVFSCPAYVPQNFKIICASSVSHTITAIAGSGGSISPSGAVIVPQGSYKNFTIIPNSGYHITGVLVDGSPVGAVTFYNFTNVQADHTISASFAQTVFTITATAGSGGSISPSGAVAVAQGGYKNFSISPIVSCHIIDVIVDGGSVGVRSWYNFTNVQGDHMIHATFAINQYTITASAGSGGSIVPSGAVLVNYGGFKNFSITPDSGYHISGVLVDGNPIGAVTFYNFTSVQADHTIAASFTINQYTLILTTSGTGVGTIQASPGPYYYGSTATIWANASTGSSFTGFTGSLTGTSSPQVLTFDGNEAVDAGFSLNGPYTLTLTTSGMGSGTIQASAGPYYYGSTATVWANASTGSTFSGFSGSLTGTSSPQVLTFDGNEVVDAGFSLNGPYTLTLTTSGMGSGTIQASAGPYYYGSTATVWANASTGSTFSGFTGSLTGSTSPQVLTFDGNEAVDAGFSLNGPYTLTLTKSGAGSGSIQASPGPYYFGSTATVWANASTGSTFSGFSGSLTGTSSPQVLTFDGNEAVDAGFSLNGPYTLTLTTSGMGSGTIQASAGPYFYGSLVTIWANASTGSSFTGFSGSLTGSSTPQVLTFDGNEAVDAGFSLNGPYTLTLTKSGAGSGSIQASPGPYFYGSLVTIWANASTGSSFTGFSGSLTGTSSPQVLTFDGNEAVDAGFSLNGPYTLTLTKSGAGSGSIQASPGPYYFGSTATVWANASTGSTFSGFSGSLTGTSSPQVLTFDGNEAVDAGFSLNGPYTLTLTTSGMGSGTIQASAGPYFYGSLVTIWANASTGSSFTGFSGSLTGSSTPQVLTFDGNEAVDAGFSLNGPYTLTLTKSGAGSGSIQASPGPYFYGSLVTIWANASTGSSFTGFSGSLTGTSSPQVLTFDGNEAVDAGFSLNGPYTLTLTKSGAGSGSIQASPGPYYFGSTATVWANASTGSTFSGFSGSLTGTSSPQVLTFDGNEAVDAGFSLNGPYTLTLTTSGMGSGTIQASAGPYFYGSLVTIWANASTGSSFTGFSGSLTGSSTPQVLTFDGNEAVDAGFSLNGPYTLTLTKSGAGSGSIQASPGPYYFGSTATVWANASTGSTFSGFSGSLTGTSSPQVLTFDGNEAVDAGFSLNGPYTLTLTTSGMGSGTIQASAGPYFYGSLVTIWANASTGSSFTGFSGSLTGSSTPQVLTFDGNEAVDAGFSLNGPYTLTLTKSGAGSGSIQASPGPYFYGSLVTIWANASTGSSFTGFSGSLTGSSTPQVLTFDGNEAVDAGFSLNGPYTLTLTKSGAGSGSIQASPGPYYFGSTATVWANASTGSTFSGFSGSLTGTSSPQVLTFDGNEAVDAGFSLNGPYTLTLTTSGMGSGTIQASAGPYFYGSLVTIWANASTGSSFTGFSGSLTGSSTPQVLTFDGNEAVDAGFSLNGPYTLTLTKSGAGSGSIQASPGPYFYGSLVTIWANASTGSSFTGFSGSLTGTSSPQVLTFDGNEAVDAGFSLNGPYTLTLTKSGAGSGSIQASPGPYYFGSTATVWANASTGSTFSGFSGSLTGTSSPQVLTFDGNEAVDAGFSLNGPYTLTLTTSGMGSGTIQASAGPYFYGSLVTIWANASTGSSFTGFSGSLTGSSTPQVLTFDGNEAVDAGFSLNGPYTLTLTKSGAGSGSIQASPGPYYYGSTATVWANASTGSTFSGFSGSLTGTSSPQVLTFDGNEAVDAAFTLNGPYTLTLTKSGAGSGSIQASPGPYYYGSTATVWANASTGSTFSGFSGSLTGTSSPQVLTFDGNEAVDAGFSLNGPYTLTLTKSGTGSGTIQASAGPYYYGSTVTVWANVSVGSSFGGFSGSLAGTTTPQVLIFNGDESVNAGFTQNEYTLTISTVGSGSVVKVPDQITYHYGDVVQLTASADLGWTFAGWSGDLSGSLNPSSITIDGDKVVTATFTQNEYTLTITIVGSGSIEKVPDQSTYHYGDVVQLTASANLGWTFSGWSGDLTGTTNPDTLTIDGDTVVTATFTQNEYMLTVATVGSGSVMKLPDQVTYHYGDVVQLTANADVGWSFSEWSGDLSGSLNPSSIMIDGDKAVIATFTQNEYTLTVTTVGSGSVVKNPDQVSYHYGNVVQLTASADLGWTFSVWSGDLSGTVNPTSITIDGNKAVTATFTQNEYTLTVTTVGSGSADKNPDQATYHYGDVVQLTATADPNWIFSHWTGDLVGSTNPDSITINGDNIITAVFTQNEYTLTITTVGQGSVMKNPDQLTYPSGTLVQLTASEDPGWTFNEWSQDLTGSTNPATITMDGDKAVTATFVQNEYTLAISTVGSGNVVLVPDQATYHYGDVVQLTANNDLGWQFDQWSGDLTGSANPGTITIDGNKSVTATFIQIEYTLTITTVGSGTVANIPDQTTYHYGDAVQLTASADLGWTFSHWGGDLAGSLNPASITIDGNKAVTATFTQNEYTLTVTTVGSGSVAKIPDQVTYHYGDFVQLVATADLGWSFSEWSGDLTGIINPSTIMIVGDTAIVATFVQNEYTLTIGIVGSGSVGKLPDQLTYHYGDVVQLTASADLGWTFAGWSGDLTGVTNPEMITIDEDKAVTATFTQNEYTLTIAIVGSGAVDVVPDQATYHYGDVVQLTATADIGWTFNGWSGDLTGTTNPDTITFDGNKDVTATFSQNEYTLTITTVGLGTVTKDPDQPTYHYGDVVSLTATADPSWTFSHWSGDLVGSTNPDSLTMTGDMNTEATFTQNEYTLTITIVGSGSVLKVPDQTTYPWGTVVQLTANADPGWHFESWSGDLSGAINPTTITIDGDKAVTATFTQNEYTLSITTIGSGSVVKQPDTTTYHYNDVVQLTATAELGWHFDQWSEDLTGSTNPATITMDGDKAVTATFVQNEYTLTISIVGAGAVAQVPDQTTYHYGDIIQLTADADVGWTFSQWSGDLSGNLNPTSVTIDGDKSVTATFTQNEYTLTISTVGSGSVVKVPDQVTYHYGDVVQLTASADLGWTFSEWSGDLSGGLNPVSIMIDGDKAVIATFAQNEYTLTVTTVGSGSVVKNPDQVTYHYGNVVQLSATADIGWTFAGWSGDLTGTTNPEIITIDEDKSVTATFTQNEYTLSITTVGSGYVTKLPDKATYHYNDVVQLTATADLGWTFAGWSGDLTGTTNPDTLTIDGDKAVTATFTENPPVNNPPVANAGLDQTVFVSAIVQLNGAGSSDVDGDPLTYVWSFVSKPVGSAAVLSSAVVVNPSFVADGSGSYVVQLVVNDGLVDSAPDTVTITALNTPPVADAGPDQSVSVGALVLLSGAGSSDVDGDPLTYVWSFVSKPVGSAAVLSSAVVVNPSFVADGSGSYVVQLVVNDGLVDSAPDTVTITALNTPPVADAGPDQSVSVGALVLLSGAGSSDVDGDPLTYVWSFVSKPVGSAAVLSSAVVVNPSFVADGSGSYVVQLVVNDGLVDSAPDTVSITALNTPPVADAGPDQSVSVGALVLLSGAGSSDVDGDPLTYVWSFVSKPVGSAAVLSSAVVVNPSFVADGSGSYVVQLVVNDGLVDSAPDTVSITALNTPPVADAGPDQSVSVGALVLLSGAGSSDVDGDPLTYVWSFVSKPVGSAAVLSSAVVVNPSFVADGSGSYVVQLVVNDGLVDSAPDTVTISTINQPPYQPSNPVPSNGATNVALTTGLSWTGGDPDLDDSVSYDVYFGLTNPPQKIVGNQSATSYSPGTLTNDTQYYWKVIAWDTTGASAIGPIWSFTTTSGGVSWWSHDWFYRKEITIDHTLVDADLVNFPVLISFGSDVNLAAHAQPDGDDLVFTDVAGNTLNHEIELYDGGTGHLVAWVNVTGLSSTSDTILYLYYGNSLCGNQQNQHGTWNSQYLMVHHMNETGNIYDSTSHGLNAFSYRTSTESNGKIDGCRYFNNVDDRYDFVNSSELNPGLSSWTISLWTKTSYRNGDNILQKWGSNVGFYLKMYNGWGGHNYFQINDGVKVAYRYWNTSWTDGNWHYVTIVINRVTNRLDVYLDGVLNNGGGRPDISGFGSIATSQLFRMYGGFNGRHDEFCISTAVRDAGWIQTCYNNQNNPADFYGVGNEERLSNQPPIVSNEIPQNGMENVDVHQGIVSVDISDVEGDPLDWTIEGKYVLSTGQTGDDNGTKTAGLVTSLPSGSEIVWYVNVTDPLGSGIWIHNVYSFRTQSVPSWWNTDWLYRKEIMIDHTKVSSDLTNFPVLISLASDSNLASIAQSDGDDIVFTDTNGNKLNHEVERFNNSTGQLIVWVNVTSLSSSVDTRLYLYYGNSLCNSQQNPQGTWNAEYLMVHHMNETGNIYDSTSHGLNAFSYRTSTESNGKIDGCRYFNNVDDRYDFVNSSELNPGLSSWTISLWTKTSYRNGDNILQKWGSNVGFYLKMYNGWGGHNYFQINDGVKVAYRYWNTSWTDGNWHYVTIVINRVTNRLDVYLDGVLNNGGGRPDISGFGSIATSQLFRMYGGFNGRHDEFCISTAVRDAGWIQTCYNNQNNPSNFYSIGSQESGV